MSSKSSIPIIIGPVGNMAVKKFEGRHLLASKFYSAASGASKWSSWESIDEMLFFSLLRQELKMIGLGCRTGTNHDLINRNLLIRRTLIDEAL